MFYEYRSRMIGNRQYFLHDSGGTDMSGDMDRRAFLKTAAVTGTAFLAGGIAQGRAFAQGLVKIPEAEKIVITVITDNLADALGPDYKIAKRHIFMTSPLEAMLHAEPGLAYHVETVVMAQSHSFLFDFATDFRGVKKNIELLKLDLKRVEALALSHDHVDPTHCTGFEAISAFAREMPDQFILNVAGTRYIMTE
jgi:hypothetical protein